MKKLFLARVYFFLARIFQGRGMLIGQWFQNKGILLLTGVKVEDD
jgi:hypothetical protein